MKLTVLADNNTMIDRYFEGEPGVSYFIETEGIRILFDTGYSGLFIRNAGKLGIDPGRIDYLVISHGHIDHTGGLEPLVKMFLSRRFEDEHYGRDYAERGRPVLLYHPDAFLPRISADGTYLGPLVSSDVLDFFFDSAPSKGVIRITEKLFFLGEIPRVTEFEAGEPIGKIKRGSVFEDDFLFDDTAIAYAGDDGLVIITGCSHSGICNIMEYAKKVTGENRVQDVIGGFHLLDPPLSRIDGTVRYMRENRPETVHACHCTDLKSKAAISGAADLEETGSGLVLEYR